MYRLCFGYITIWSRELQATPLTCKIHLLDKNLQLKKYNFGK